MSRLEPPNKRRRADGGLSYLLGGDSSSDQLLQTEFDRYIAAGDADLDALEWWKKHEKSYPKLAIMARKYLSIPATSVQSERLFSATGRLISKSRSRLLPDHAELLVFLNKNMDLMS